MKEICDFCGKPRKYVAATQEGIFCEDCLRIMRADLLRGIKDIQEMRDSDKEDK